MDQEPLIRLEKALNASMDKGNQPLIKAVVEALEDVRTKLKKSKTA